MILLEKCIILNLFPVFGVCENACESKVRNRVFIKICSNLNYSVKCSL